eukprot:333119-Chlamydomonas_euryale.AAC.2
MNAKRRQNGSMNAKRRHERTGSRSRWAVDARRPQLLFRNPLRINYTLRSSTTDRACCSSIHRSGTCTGLQSTRIAHVAKHIVLARPFGCLLDSLCKQIVL